MKIKSLTLKNFRSYRNITINFDNDMNVLIGKNDVGKSTIMESLEIFFNNELVKLQQDDLNLEAQSLNDTIVQIQISFLIERTDRIIIDTSFPTNLSDEFLLDNEYLTLIKEWDCSKPVKAASMKYYLQCNYPQVWANEPLLTLTQAKLRTKIKELENILDEQTYKGIKLNANAPMRQALHDYLLSQAQKDDLVPITLDLNKGDDTKNLKTNIDQVLPLFFLFQSDRANRDSDKDVQNPLNIAIQKALEIPDIKNKLDEVERLMKDQITSIGNATLAKLNEMDSSIASTLTPDYSKEPEWKSVFKFSFTGDGIPLNKRGSGVRRLVLLNYFRAEAERQIDDRINKSVIYAIEEPETSQHPDYQKMLIEAILELSEHPHHQVIITTHTPNLAKMVEAKNVIALIRDRSGRIIEFTNEDEMLETVTQSLGILPSLDLENVQKVKVVVCFEGYTDIEFFKNINQNIQEYKDIIDVNDDSILMIFLGGSTLEHWVNNRYLEKLNIPEIHIYDSDSNQIELSNRNKYRKFINKINRRPNADYAFETKKAELENYLHPELIKEKYQFETIYHTGNVDWLEVWSNQLNMERYVKDNKTNQEHTKKGIFAELSKKITKTHLEELEAFEEIKEWTKKIKELSEL